MRFPSKQKDNVPSPESPATEPARPGEASESRQSRPPQPPEPGPGQSARLWMFALIAVVLVAGAGVGWGFFQNTRGEKAHRQQVAELGGQLEQVQRRQVEEKARADQAQRLSDSLKTQLAEIQVGYEALQLENQTSILQSQEQIRELKTQIGKMHDKSIADQARNERLQAENQQVQAGLKQAWDEAGKLTTQGEQLEKKLRYTTGQRDRCVGHNAELSQAAADLLDAYENKGVFSALISKEPITGLKKIEIEHLLQTYRQQVGKNTLP